jgi:hypothetical protein
MKYKIFCDESRHIEKDLKNRFMVVGGIFLPENDEEENRNKINLLRQKYNCLGEVKWNNVSPSKLQFYLDLVDLFFTTPSLSFRCVVVDKAMLRHEEFNQGSHEIFFYKTYYILLKKPICHFNKCDICLAYKDKFSDAHSKELARILRRKLIFQSLMISDPTIVPAKDSVFIQLADLLIGAVGYQHNNYSTSQAKIAVCNQICKHIGKPNLVFSSPYKNDFKFEIFILQLR